MVVVRKEVVDSVVVVAAGLEITGRRCLREVPSDRIRLHQVLVVGTAAVLAVSRLVARMPCSLVEGEELSAGLRGAVLSVGHLEARLAVHHHRLAGSAGKVVLRVSLAAPVRMVLVHRVR